MQFSVGLKYFVMDGGRVGGGGGRDQNMYLVLFTDIKVMKTVKQSSTNQNSCKCLREALTI